MWGEPGALATGVAFSPVSLKISITVSNERLDALNNAVPDWIGQL